MSSITIYLTNSSGVPLTGQTVKLRRAGLDNFGTDYLTMVDVAGKPGKYKTVDAYVSDRYKVWVNAAEDESFGGPDGLEITKQSDILLKSGGTMTGVINMGSQKITALANPTENTDATSKGWVDTEKVAKSGSTMSGNLNMDGNKVTNLAAATADGDAVSKQAMEQKLVDEDYAKRTANNTFTGTNTFTNQMALSNYPPLCDNDPTTGDHLTRRSWVISQINNAASPYQESVNVVRLMPEGSNQTGKVYTSWASANAYLAVAGDLRRMTLLIQGAGTDGSTINMGDLLSYVSYVGINQNLVAVISGTGNWVVTAGSSIVEKLMIYCNDPDGEFEFEGVIFDSVYFNLQDSTSIVFTNCHFRNCFIKVLEGSSTFTNCKGGNNISNVDIGKLGSGGLDPNDF